MIKVQEKIIVVLTLVILLVSLPLGVMAKSENSNNSGSSNGSGNSGKSDSGNSGNSNKGENSDKENKSGKSEEVSSNPGQANKEQKEEKDQNKGKKSENNSSLGQDSDPKRGKSEASENKGHGKVGGMFISSEGKDKTATGEGKLKKLDKVVVKEATEAAQSKRRAVQGIISSLTDSQLVIVHQIHRDRSFTVLLGSETLIKSKSKEGSGSATLKVGLRVVVVGDLDENGRLIARMIHIIPGKAGGIFKRNPVASSSALPSILPSNTPVATTSAATN